MSDQSLREALEDLIRDRESSGGHTASDYAIAPHEVRDLLAAHPAEPEQDWLMIHHIRVVREAGYIVSMPWTPVLTDKAVEAVARTFAEARSQAWLTYSDETRAELVASWMPTARIAMEAAAPLLDPRPPTGAGLAIGRGRLE